MTISTSSTRFLWVTSRSSSGEQRPEGTGSECRHRESYVYTHRHTHVLTDITGSLINEINVSLTLSHMDQNYPSTN